MACTNLNTAFPQLADAGQLTCVQETSRRAVILGADGLAQMGLTAILLAGFLLVSLWTGDPWTGMAPHLVISGALFGLVVLAEILRATAGTPRARTYSSPVVLMGVPIAGGLLVLSIGAAFHVESLAIPMIGTHILATASACLLSRTIFRTVEGKAVVHVAILGLDDVALSLARHLEANSELGYKVVGFIDRRSPEHGMGRPSVALSKPILGTASQLVALSRNYFLDEILITAFSDHNLVVRVAEEANRCGVRVRVVPDLYNGKGLQSPVEYVGQFPTMTVNECRLDNSQMFLKRTMDLIGSTMALVAVAPIMFLIALLVRMDSKGPILYRSVRIGRKGRSFTCLKFRTMVANADRLKASLAQMNERDGILFKISNDPRITRIGRILRRYSLDELPQFINVFRGDMSLVGPRPPIAGEVEQYKLDHLRRLEAMPGITGLWQVEARKNPSFDNYVSLDIQYIDNWSIGLDARILLRTVGVVLAGTGQ